MTESSEGPDIGLTQAVQALRHLRRHLNAQQISAVFDVEPRPMRITVHSDDTLELTHVDEDREP